MRALTDDRVRRAHDLADLDVDPEEGHELGPGVLPQAHDRRIELPPRVAELQEPFHRRGLGRGGVDRAQRLGDGVEVLAAGSRSTGRKLLRNRCTTQVWVIVWGQVC
jgi:hypothetical protein